jgi:hypothetical protein
MNIGNINSEYRNLIVSSTGEKIDEKTYKIIYYPFENYLVTVIVDSENNFIGIDLTPVNNASAS